MFTFRHTSTCAYYKVSTKTQNTKPVKIHKNKILNKQNKNNMRGKSSIKMYQGKSHKL